MKTSNEADEKFKKAFRALSAHGMKYCVDATAAGWMPTADAKDEYSVSILKTWRWPKRLPVTLTLPHNDTDFYLYVQEDKSVEFLIHKFLIDNSPTRVKGEPAHPWLGEVLILLYASESRFISGITGHSLVLQPFHGP
jgi:hypothetical protein